LGQMPTSPISAVHLWFDRPITPLDHAVLVGRMSQWVFNRGVDTSDDPERGGTHYYQVVISASRDIAGRSHRVVIDRACEDLVATLPAAAAATLVHGRVVTDRDAVFTPTAEWEALRPRQTTPVRNLFLCGDWTATGWPATMESAVRSGRLAAEGVLSAVQGGVVAESLVTADLRRGWLARRLLS
ncbi:MAG: FAD-dependent oxidoreductase, partial [Pirellulales bacterium]